MDSKKALKHAWENFVGGDEASFETVYKGYYGSLFAYGIKLNNQSEIVKDCIHDLFKNIWERRKELEHIHSPNVYLFVSLRRKILKRVKAEREKRGDFSETDGSVFTEFSKEDFIIRDEIRREQREQLEHALNQLSNRQREVIYLHFYNGMSYGEIEQILSINRQSVRNHVFGAMQTLRSLLDQHFMKLVISLLLTLTFLNGSSFFFFLDRFILPCIN
ncbi:RNA polymerase sigma factor [Gracilimonas mengyeensis]|uniref:RNA polymerase sigma factor, sigma-70 family n=1 Tax=Gracilimonas mengyeensis TaxID=1302730 RepID=A0A521FGP0_9BACT|nr:sigma-70 family RNA polymerase sigma factor [Gracilimonas mengyeensis]SMO95368.1 RNA polymerase sigma factor, sigma-70 family [Gracilimonas mengyeensis]